MNPEIRTLYLMMYANPLTPVAPRTKDIVDATEILKKYRVDGDKEMLRMANSWLMAISM
jgi:hypothetical protein